MIGVLQSEILKLRRSLIVLLMLAVPCMLLVVEVALVASGEGPGNWQMAALSAAAIWSFFLLPMTATALTALLAQIEHGARGWTYALAQPYPKWQVFAAKAVISMGAMAVISVLIGFAVLLGGYGAGLIMPDVALEGAFPAGQLFSTLSKMWLASFLLVSLQFVVAMRFSSFAVPIILGIFGTFVAVVATSAKYGAYFPWLLPTNVLTPIAERASFVITLGLIGGIIIFAVSVVWLGRRDWK